jgi:tetratricopeptide (TPR) repeat protein
MGVDQRRLCAVLELAMFSAFAFAQTSGGVVERSLALFNAGDYQQSYSLLSSYVQEHPDSAAAHKILGMAQFMLGKTDDALITMKRAVELAPADADAHYYLGRLFFTKDNPVAALSSFQKSAELSPSVRAFNQIGQSYEAMGRLADAEKAYLEAIALDQKQPKRSEWPYFNLGQLLANQSKREQGVAYLRQSLELNPRFVEGMIKLGALLGKSGDRPEGLNLLRKAVELEPNNAEAHYKLGQLLVQSGMLEEGEGHLSVFRKLKKR